jgi:hypothetical protein
MTGCDITESVLVRALCHPRLALHCSLGARNTAALAAGRSVSFDPEGLSVNDLRAAGRTARTLETTFEFSTPDLTRPT